MSPELARMTERMAWGHVHRLFPNVDRSDKEDMVQEAMVKVWRKRASADQPKLVSTIAKRAIIDAARKMFGRYERAQTAISHQVYLDAYECADELRGHHTDEYPSIVNAPLTAMKPDERAIFRLYEAGYEGQEIAHAMGRHPSRISQRCGAGRKRAQRALREAA